MYVSGRRYISRLTCSVYFHNDCIAQYERHCQAVSEKARVDLNH